jgi:hypothetical protein
LFVSKLVNQLFCLFADLLPVRDDDKVKRWGLHVLTNFGLSGFLYFLSNCLAVQLEDKLRAYKSSNLGHRLGEVDFQDRLMTLNTFRLIARERANELIGSIGKEFVTAFPRQSIKFERVLDLLVELRHYHSKKFKGMSLIGLPTVVILFNCTFSLGWFWFRFRLRFLFLVLVLMLVLVLVLILVVLVLDSVSVSVSV